MNAMMHDLQQKLSIAKEIQWHDAWSPYGNLSAQNQPSTRDSNTNYIGLLQINPPTLPNNLLSQVEILFLIRKNHKISHARTSLSAFRLWYQLWQNRQIKTLN